ncbi:DUF4238 domain-containing protein [Bradyrhizobium iriomotense]|uniref:DUF4238 domain-containing protein n=1 Tax=Bradyrhizobium iriomotense TaxID=441950 RepID=UPI001B8A44DE|nr:DUF4238 domain-containing protein [Bradyrhizobium iriomotense]MBR1130956.1 DUF4238 domain-containing protein [Bradyrhizobium iriomotense]
MAEARKHHYVPQMYLSGFANASGQLWASDASIPKAFRAGSGNIAAERDWNKLEIDGVPADALEKELGNFEGGIAPAIKRVRETASFGQAGQDREDIINLVTLLAVRNLRTREGIEQIETDLLRAILVEPFKDPKRWDAVVEQMKAAELWPEGEPTDFDGFKKYVEDNKDKLHAHKNMTLEMELEALPRMYPFFDARRWRILKAKEGTGGFVTTDHPVCVHKPGAPVNYGQLYAPGFGMADRDIVFPLSFKVCLIGRLDGEEDVMEVDLHNVASVNATVMGFALKQIYSLDDQFYYTCSPHLPMGRGFTLPADPHFVVREG